MGTVVGASAGAGRSGYAAYQAQRGYDIAYQQCMYSKGNLVSGVTPPGQGWAAPPVVLPLPRPPPAPLPPPPR